jgi:putative transposase
MRLPYNDLHCLTRFVRDLPPSCIACHHELMAHPPRIPVWLPDEQSVIYFVTICVADRKPVLANDDVFNAFKIAASKLKHWKILAGVVMPDHLHVIVTPIEDRDARIGDFSAALKRWIRKEIQKDGKRSACPTTREWEWQPGCFDRLLRSDESLQNKWLYVEENPVRAGLVKRFEDWPYRFAFNEEES